MLFTKNFAFSQNYSSYNLLDILIQFYVRKIKVKKSECMESISYKLEVDTLPCRPDYSEETFLEEESNIKRAGHRASFSRTSGPKRVSVSVDKPGDKSVPNGYSVAPRPLTPRVTRDTLSHPRWMEGRRGEGKKKEEGREGGGKETRV